MYMSLKVLEALEVLRNAAENDFERHRLDVLIQDLTAPPTDKLRKQKKMKQCIICGKSFVPIKHETLCCSQACGNKLAWQTTREKNIIKKICPICKKEFIPARKEQE